ncbi:MAG: hypothetical protein IBJ03_16770 [Gemmatimonadaceae bacterium]|nr:hypothetical protein [Gemmatimonadaceae bacterium]
MASGAGGLTTGIALPPAVRLPHADVVAVDRIRDDLAQIVHSHASVYQWAEEQPQPRALRGRAPVYVATLPTSGVTVVVRHSWHGGLLAPITGDRFRRPTRAPQEMQRSIALRAAGIPTTEVLGFVRYDAGAGLARVDVVSRYVDDTADLGMILAGLDPELEGEAALTATLTLLQKLAAHGVVHPDLNVKNVLLRRQAVNGPEAMIIDVDVVDWNPERPASETMARNVARLVRSLHKWRRQFGCDLADPRIESFAESALALTRDTTHAPATA